MERELGEVFTYNGELYQVVKSSLCNDCAFMKNGSCYTVNELLGPCDYTKRTDKINVIFKKINNMEIKNNQLTINIPKGYIIDVEHSDLSKGIIKFKKNNITIEDIYKDKTSIQFASNNIYADSTNPYCNKLSAIAALMDIANYYNKGWKPNWNNSEELKYHIVFDFYYNIYRVKNWTKMSNNIIYFAHEENAQAVIDNPNFRDILDTIYKN